MKNIINIIKKELKRVFQDKRLLFSTILLPGLLLFCIYNLMGTVTKITESSNQEQQSLIYINNATEDYIAGVKIVRDSLKKPIITLCENAGLTGEVIIGEIDLQTRNYNKFATSEAELKQIMIVR